MSTPEDITEEDVAAMRKQGDLPAYLRGLIHRANARRTARPAVPQAANTRPGPWPATHTGDTA